MKSIPTIFIVSIPYRYKQNVVDFEFISIEEVFQSPIGTNKTNYKSLVDKTKSLFQSPIGTNKTLSISKKTDLITFVSIPYRYK